MKYLVMECFESYAVLLDEEGRFVKSANLGYEIGDTVVNPILMRDEPLEPANKISLLPKRLVTGVVAIAAMFGLFFGYNYYQNNMAPYTSIFMAINPEVEMVLNKQGDVLRVNGTNADGQDLIEGYTPSSKNKVEVANELVDRAIEMGYLADGGRVSIAIDTPDQALFEEYGIELRRELDGRLAIVIEITDIENKDKPTQTPPPKAPIDDDDSGYDDNHYEDLEDDDSGNDDDSGYDDDSNYNGSSKSTPKAPVAKPATKKPAAKTKPKTTTKPTSQSTTPQPKKATPPADDDDSDYDDTDYDDTDYDDSDYDDSDYDDSDYDD